MLLLFVSNFRKTRPSVQHKRTLYVGCPGGHNACQWYLWQLAPHACVWHTLCTCKHIYRMWYCPGGDSFVHLWFVPKIIVRLLINEPMLEHLVQSFHPWQKSKTLAIKNVLSLCSLCMQQHASNRKLFKVRQSRHWTKHQCKKRHKLSLDKQLLETAPNIHIYSRAATNIQIFSTFEYFLIF